ncbi:MAG: bifunctional 4-hydroxy-3-methylbut-2-enyl diphosphate reductase/30S ribosomal protein S1 [Clostridia bacterium]|nr:bifunctional 4-hydroxy-3-methylbut-2-enyl diphosphate reductase/30S ribosomal protein S1 [Clostridia bacterium]
MIIVSEHAGFCFGVRRATDALEELISKKAPSDIVCTLGKLIHNEQYIEYLEERGVRVISKDELEALFESAKRGTHVTLVTRTHGIEKETEKTLEAYADECSNFKIVDSACPYVKKIHKIVQENSRQDTTIFLIGQKDHPEVLSIKSYIEGNGYIFASATELEEHLKAENYLEKEVIMVAQTTQKLSEWKKCQEILKKYCTNAKIFDTICSVTEKRQTEAQHLSQKTDIMLVIGGTDSSNTAKLYQICCAHAKRAFWIQTHLDIPFDEIKGAHTIGITAGASTPDNIIQEVKKTMSNIMEENFAELFEASERETPKIYKGAIVKGIVMSISENEICLDLGVKQTGSIKRDQITSDNDIRLCDLFKIGDEIEAKVISKSDRDGEIVLSKKAVDDVKNWEKIVELASTGEIVEATITRATKGGLIAVVDGVDVFVPASMTGVGRDKDFSVLVGTNQKIKIVEIKADKRSAIGSIKAVLKEERKAAEEAFWAGIEEGVELEGPVKSITTYGAFVDLGVLDGLVHITELSWKRIKHPSEVVSVGDVIKVFVKSFDKDARKISLGYKTEDQNPWNIFTEKYTLDDVAEVKIVSITSFGVFAEIVPGVDGLIHISQIANQKIENVNDIIKVGDVVEAKIVAIDDEKQKVSLSIRALLPEEEVAEQTADAPAEESVEEVVEEVAEEVAEVVEEVAEVATDAPADDENADA